MHIEFGCVPILPAYVAILEPVLLYRFGADAHQSILSRKETNELLRRHLNHILYHYYFQLQRQIVRYAQYLCLKPHLEYCYTQSGETFVQNQ